MIILLFPSMKSAQIRGEHFHLIERKVTQTDTKLCYVRDGRVLNEEKWPLKKQCPQFKYNFALKYVHYIVLESNQMTLSWLKNLLEMEKIFFI